MTTGVYKFAGEMVWESVSKVEGKGEAGLQGSATGGCPLCARACAVCSRVSTETLVVFAITSAFLLICRIRIIRTP